MALYRQVLWIWHCTLWRSAIFRLGGFVPIAVFGFDRAFDHSREFGGVLGPVVASTVVVGVDVFWRELRDGFCCCFGTHCKGQVHADKGHVDVFKRAHFGRAFGVARDIDTQAVNCQNIAVVPPLRVEIQAVFCRVIGGDRVDGDVVPNRVLAVGNRAGFGFERLWQHVQNSGVGNQCCRIACECCKRVGVIVIAMLVGDQDQVGGGQIGIK